MLKWCSGLFFILLAFCANAEDDFFIVPVKSIRFIHKKKQDPIPVSTYILSFESKFDCNDAKCRTYRANSTSSTEVSGSADSFQTLPMKIPKMPDAGPLVLTFSVPGVCRKQESCSVKISYEKFILATEPVVFHFDYDESASKELRKKKQKAGAESIAEIEEKMGKTLESPKEPDRKISSLNESDLWKKYETDFQENRKKLNPMSYSKDSVAKLGLTTWLCNQTLQSKIASCEVHACIYASEIKGVKINADLIIHGFNKAGNCAISLPGGKRFFVPKAELAFFYDSFISTLSAGMELNDPCQNQATSCREKKTDLLFQLNNRRLATDYVPVQIGVFSGK